MKTIFVTVSGNINPASHRLVVSQNIVIDRRIRIKSISISCNVVDDGTLLLISSRAYCSISQASGEQLRLSFGKNIQISGSTRPIVANSIFFDDAKEHETDFILEPLQAGEQIVITGMVQCLAAVAALADVQGNIKINYEEVP